MTHTSRETPKRPYKKRMECDQAKMISPPEGGVGDSWSIKAVSYVSKKATYERRRERTE